jgi:lipopolysaccharide heptosyltransferase II
VIDCGTVGIPGHYSLSDYMKLARTLRRYNFDLAFILDRSPMVTMLPWLAGIPRRIGPDSLGRGFSLTTRVPVSSSHTELQHEAEIYLDLARATRLPVSHPRMQFEPTEVERQAVLSSSHMQVALLPGGGSNPGMELTAKRWPLDRYRELARRLVQELDAEVLLIGGPDDAALNAQLLEGLDVAEGSVKNIAGKTSFGELAAQLERCALLIGNDSSPMHLAAAVGIPVIAIFGPTSPQEYGPYPLDDPKHIALWHPLSEQPCFFMGRMQTSEQCRCIEAVTLDEVWQAVQQLIPSIESKEVAP